MSKAKKLISKYLKDIEAGKPLWARKTTFIPQADGSMRRLLIRNDGTIEKDEIISPEQRELVAARAQSGLSQMQFAERLGVSKRTLQEWEQGRKQPSGAARVLLKMVARHPEWLRESV